VISQATTDLYLLRYLFSGRSSLHFKWSNCRLQRQLVREIFAIGSSAFIRQVSGSLMAIIANHYLRHYGGDLAIATYGIIHRVTAFFFMPLFGISQGAQPIIGYNYGAHRYDKTRRALQLSNGAVTTITFMAFAILMLFPRPIISIFTDEKELIDWGVHSIRIFILSRTDARFSSHGKHLSASFRHGAESLLLDHCQASVHDPAHGHLAALFRAGRNLANLPGH